MFDSLNNDYFPICLIVVVIAWYVAMLRNGVIRIGLAGIIPIIISSGWFFVPRIGKLFTPLRIGEDPWVSWGIVASAAWSLVAVPLSVTAVVAFSWIQRRNKGSKNRL